MTRGPTIAGRVRMVLHRGVRGLSCSVLRRRPPAASPARVTFLLGNAYGIGGTTRTCLNLAAHLAGDHEVEVLSLVRERTDPAFAFAPGLTVTALVDRRNGRRGPLDRLPSILMLPLDHRMHRWASLRTDLALLRALWRVRRGVLIGTRPAFNVLVARLGRPGLRTIVQEHINLDTHGPRMRAELLPAYARADIVATLTEHDRSRLDVALARRATVVAIPNAVPPTGGTDGDPRSTEIVAVGRLVRQKGFDLLLDAFAQIAEQAPDWTVRICGGGELRGALEQQVEALGLEGRVRLTGPVRDVGRHLSRGSIYVLSSRFEGLPLAMLEAMSKRLAVAAFDCPTGPAEVITDGLDGMLVAPEDVDALARALLWLIGDEQRRARLGAAAQRRAADFGIDAVGAAWEAVIRPAS